MTGFDKKYGGTLMEEKKGFSHFKRGKRILILAVIFVVICAICFGGGFFFSKKSSQGSKITSDTLFEQVQAVSSIATLEYNYTNMGKFTDNTKLNGWSIPLTEKSFILTYDGKITAGIQMDAIKIDIRGKNITITVPPAEILSHQVDEKSIEVYDETKNIFNQISVSDYAAFSAKQKKVMEEKAVEGGLLKEAQDRAEKVISKLLKNDTKIATDYEISFKVAEE